MAGRLPVLAQKAPLDLGPHVERRLTARDAARVARLHEGPDLGSQLLVRRRSLERREVQGGPPAGRAAGVGGLELLLDLLVAEWVVRRLDGLAVERHVAATDVVV